LEHNDYLSLSKRTKKGKREKYMGVGMQSKKVSKTKEKKRKEVIGT